jgi:formate hydrogenlyase subunit 6/NADH:ubiquinone oxidoreductase subunit I
VRDCPAFALELERHGRKSFRLLYHPDRCAYCGQCELSCHSGAIHQSNDFVRGTDKLSGLAVVLVERLPEDT